MRERGLGVKSRWAGGSGRWACGAIGVVWEGGVEESAGAVRAWARGRDAIVRALAGLLSSASPGGRFALMTGRALLAGSRSANFPAAAPNGDDAAPIMQPR